jgi:hypothetical protein
MMLNNGIYYNSDGVLWSLDGSLLVFIKIILIVIGVKIAVQQLIKSKVLPVTEADRFYVPHMN